MITITIRYLGTVRLLAHRFKDELNFPKEQVTLEDVFKCLSEKLGPELTAELSRQAIMISADFTQPGVKLNSAEHDYILASGTCLTFVTPLTGG